MVSRQLREVKPTESRKRERERKKERKKEKSSEDNYCSILFSKFSVFMCFKLHCSTREEEAEGLNY